MKVVNMSKLAYQRDDFIEYLKRTLIPDLHSTGMHSTAKDFELSVLFMENSNICWAEVKIEDTYEQEEEL